MHNGIFNDDVVSRLYLIFTQEHKSSMVIFLDNFTTIRFHRENKVVSLWLLKNDHVSFTYLISDKVISGWPYINTRDLSSDVIKCKPIQYESQIARQTEEAEEQ